MDAGNRMNGGEIAVEDRKEIRKELEWPGELRLVKGYREQDVLRESFMELARATFDLDFQDWYENGYWGENYVPYSMAVGDRVVANVSVNPMTFVKDGKEVCYIQLGTVMTEEAYRGRGLIRRLMGEIEKDFAEKAEGCFLFANDTVLSFYPKFGFHLARETQYGRAVETREERSAALFPVEGASERKILEDAIGKSVCPSRFGMKKNVGLIMFYITKFMKNQVYYLPGQDVYAVAELEDGELFLHEVIGDHPVELDDVVKAFGSEVKWVEFGFAPPDVSGCERRIWREEDTTLFVKGEGLESFEAWGVRFPSLSHA